MEIEECFECGAKDNLIENNGEVLCKGCLDKFMKKLRVNEGELGR